MAARCSCGAAKCGALLSGDSTVVEAVQLLLSLGLDSANEDLDVSESERTSRRPPDAACSLAAAKAVDAVLLEALAAATSSAFASKEPEMGPAKIQELDMNWLVEAWRGHLQQHLGQQARAFSQGHDCCRVQQLTVLQQMTSSLMQAAESLTAHGSAGDVKVTETRPAATVAAASADARNHTASEGSLGGAVDRSTAGCAAPGPLHAALSILYGQLCCWLLQQLQQQQLELVVLERQQSGIEGRLQRVSRLLFRALATLRLPLVQRSSSIVAFCCPSALRCRCWKEAADEAQQQKQKQKQQKRQGRPQDGIGSPVALCMARRFLRGFGAAAAASGDADTSAARLRRFAAFTAQEIPCATLLQSIKQQQGNRQEDLLLLEGPVNLSVSTLLSPEGDMGAAGTAAECLGWVLASLGDLAWELSSVQPLHQPQQQRQPEGSLLRLLQLLSEPACAYLPVSSLFVRLLLKSGSPRGGAAEPHRCRAVRITLLLQLLRQNGDVGHATAAMQLLQTMHPAATAADAEALCQEFQKLPGAAQVALLRAVLLQQHEEKDRGVDGRRQRRQQKQGKQLQQLEEKTTEEHCCSYTSAAGQKMQQELLLRSIFELRGGGTVESECSTLLLLHLWLEQAPHAPLQQVLQQQQLLQLVADAAMRCWQHPRRVVYSAARTLWALLQERCSEGSSAVANCSSELLELLCVRLFWLPASSLKSLYQALSSLVRGLGAPRMLQLQPLLLPHLLSGLQIRPLRSAAMLVLSALCEDLSERDKEHQKKYEQLQRQQQQARLVKGDRQNQSQSKQENGIFTSNPLHRFRAFLLEPVREALTVGTSCTTAAVSVQRDEEQQLLQEQQLYPLLLPFKVQAAGDSPPAEALAETVLPLLLRLEPSAAAPLLVALSSRLPLKEVETAAAATVPGGGGAAAQEAVQCSESTSTVSAWRPWSSGEAALLAAARAAGLATWESAPVFGKDTAFSQCGGSSSSCSRCSCDGSRRSSSPTKTREKGVLVVRGLTCGGSVISYCVSPQRLRRGLNSGNKYIRLRLLEALTLQPQTTAAPRCEELQLMLHAAKQQLRLGSAAERSQFVAAFERLLLRGRNAHRLALSERSTEDLRGLFSNHKQGESEGNSLGCLLLFLRRLHGCCLSSCYPEAPPDRIMVSLSILVCIHSMWGEEGSAKKHWKKSTAAQAAAAEGPKGGISCLQKASGTSKTDAARGNCVLEALGLRSWTVRAQLLALLPVVAGPAPRKLVMQLLQLIPQPQHNPLPSSSQHQQEQQHQQQPGQQQQHLKLPTISPVERVRRSVWEACVMLTSLRQDECTAGAVHLQLMLRDLILNRLEVLGYKQQPKERAALAGFKCVESTEGLQAAFRLSLEEALRQVLPSPVLSTGASKRERRNNSNACCGHPASGLLAVLDVFTDAAEMRLTAIRADPRAVAEPQMALHGILSALELALAAINPSILLLPCSNNCSSGISDSRKSLSWVCTSAASSWAAWKRRLVALLQSTCMLMTSFAAAPEDEGEAEMLPSPDTEEVAAAAESETRVTQQVDAGKITGSRGTSSRPRRQMLQVDCRGHPVLSAEEESEGADREEAQQLLAYCSWRAVKAATGCLEAFWKAAAFDEAVGRGDANKAAEALPGGNSSFQGKQQPGMQEHRLLQLTVDEIAELGTSLTKFLLSCRHMGAVEFLSDALAALCCRVRNGATEKVRGLNRRWVNSILLLLLPSPCSAAGCVVDQKQQQQQLCFLEALELPRSVFVGDVALPPPLRKSKSLGLAMTAILGLGQGSSSGAQSELDLLLHVFACLLPLSECRVEWLFASKQEAFGAQVHALNMMRSLIAASGQAAGVNIRGAAAAADAAVAAAKVGSFAGADCPKKTEDMVIKDEFCYVRLQQEGEGDAAEASEADMPFAIAALFVAIKGTASAEFPVRSSANSLLVAATKRLAGSDDETQRVPAEPFLFCSGAALRGSTVASNGLLSIDAASLSFPHVQPLIAMALLPLIGSCQLTGGHSCNDREESLQRQQQHQSVHRAGEMLVRSLASRDPAVAAAAAAALPGESSSSEAGQRHLLIAEREGAGMREEAAVAVLLLLARAELSTLSVNRPPLLSIIHDSRVEEVISDLKAVAAVGARSNALTGGLLSPDGHAPATEATSSATAATAEQDATEVRWGARWGVLGSYAADEGAGPAWLRLLLRSLCCCLRSAPFASRALASRALASYVLQLSQAQGAQRLLETVVNIATVAGRAYARAQASRGCQQQAAQGNKTLDTKQEDTAPDVRPWTDANARSGLLLLLVELLGRPEVPDLFAEADSCCGRMENSCHPLKDAAAQLQLIARTPISAMERLLVLQALLALARAATPTSQEALWSLTGAVSRDALGIPEDGTEVDRARLVETLAGRSIVHRVGLPAVQTVALRTLVLCHLRPHGRAAAATAEDSCGAVEVHIRGLSTVAGVIRSALALCVHPQAVEEALRALAKGTNRHCMSRRRTLMFSLEAAEDPKAATALSTGRVVQAELSTKSAADFVEVWDLCLRLFESPIAAAAAFKLSDSSHFGQLCCLSPLRIAACRALAALATFAAPHKALCKALCKEPSAKAAAAAEFLSRADRCNERARAARVRLGAALLLCAESPAASNHQDGAAERGLEVCFAEKTTKWAASWAFAMLEAAQPTQKLATRVQAAKALAVCGLPRPCLGNCAGALCVTAKLQVWKATLLLLQDEDVWVRETAGASASHAASVLYSRLYGPPSSLLCTPKDESVRLLLAAAASSALSEEPHGVESGSLVQLLSGIISKMFPPDTSCAFLWRLLRKSSVDAVGNCARRYGINLLGSSQLQSDSKRRLFDEEPPNVYADPALSAQVATRNILLVLLQQSQVHAKMGSSSPSNGRKERQSTTEHHQAATDWAVRLAIVDATRSSVEETGAAAAAVADLGSRSTASQTECQLSDAVGGHFKGSSSVMFSDAWLIRMTRTISLELQALTVSLDALTIEAATGSGGSKPRFANGCNGDLLLHATQGAMFLPMHTLLLCSWLLTITWASRELALTHKAFTSLEEAIRRLWTSLAQASGKGQMPHPQVFEATEALLAVMNHLKSTGCPARVPDTSISRHTSQGSEFTDTGHRQQDRNFEAPSDFPDRCDVAASAANAARKLTAACLFVLSED